MKWKPAVTATEQAAGSEAPLSYMIGNTEMFLYAMFLAVFVTGIRFAHRILSELTFDKSSFEPSLCRSRDSNWAKE
jgi:hypothetical protein